MVFYNRAAWAGTRKGFREGSRKGTPYRGPLSLSGPEQSQQESPHYDAVLPSSLVLTARSQLVLSAHRRICALDATTSARRLSRATYNNGIPSWNILTSRVNPATVENCGTHQRHLEVLA